MSKNIWAIFYCVSIFLSCTAQSRNAVKFEDEILFYTNHFREKNNLPPLKLVSAISYEAANHSQNMASGRVPFGHIGFQQRTNYLHNKLSAVATGENVAYGNLSAKEVVDIWIKSPPHRKNLLGNFTMVGIGIARNDQGLLFFTQLFAR
ncbi:MAG: CAP domain-containing protein [Arachidicoccus sp.]|nr:CAP domain-containing protein [Arachidicoccus sp.]